MQRFDASSRRGIGQFCVTQGPLANNNLLAVSQSRDYASLAGSSSQVWATRFGVESRDQRQG